MRIRPEEAGAALPRRRPARHLRALAALLLAAAALLGPAARAQAPDDDPANDPRVRAVAGQLLCYCGCATQTVADCACGVARKDRQAIQDDLDRGMSDDQVIAAWVETHGPQVLAAPPARGFNLLGWLLPSFLILAAAAILALWLRAAARSRPVAAAAGAGDAVDPAYLSKLQEEIDRLER